jgi:hypothetical protein
MRRQELKQVRDGFANRFKVEVRLHGVAINANR